MSKFNASKWIDVLGLITTIIGIVSAAIDEIQKMSNKKEENNEKKENSESTQD